MVASSARSSPNGPRSSWTCAPIAAEIPPEQHAAWFQLVEHKVRAMANLYRLYYAVAWNRRLAALADGRANAFADDAEAAWREDQALTDAYHALAGGKWDHMMDQAHIGYTTWQQPERQIMPEVRRVRSQSPCGTDRLCVRARCRSARHRSAGIRSHIARSGSRMAGDPPPRPHRGGPSPPSRKARHRAASPTAPASNMTWIFRRAATSRSNSSSCPQLDTDGRNALTVGSHSTTDP
jgi:hypothetical protein